MADAKDLLQAIQTGNENKAAEIIQRKPKDYLDLNTAFLEAVRYGRLRTVNLLISKECNIRSKTKFGDGALALASLHGRLEVAKKLVKLGFDVNESREDGCTSLHWASKERHAEVADFLIMNGADIEANSKYGKTPFLVAGNEKVVDLLMSRGCDVHAKDNYGDGALAVASLNGRLEVAKKLVKLGFDVNESNKDGATSLHWASQKGHAEVANFLIMNGADIEAKDKYGQTPFLVAGNEKVVDLLKSKGCDIHAKDYYGNGALAVASLNGCLEVANKLVKLGFDVNESNKDGYTSLHWASDKGHAEVADFLIMNGADIEAKSGYGRTPFLVAGNEKVIDLLMSEGCDIHAKDNYGTGALALASLHERLEVAKKLVKLGFDVNESHRLGFTSLHCASMYGCVKLADFLLGSGASLEIRDKFGRTSFLVAASFGQNDLIDLLAGKGANCFAQSHDGVSALAFACMKGHFGAAQSLLSKGLQINELDQNGCTPLHFTAQNGHDEIVSFLTENGADVEAQDKWGCTPFLTAIEFGQDTVMEVLVKKGCNMFARTTNGESALDLAVMGGRLDLVKWLADNGFRAGQLSEKTKRFLENISADEENATAATYIREMTLLLPLNSFYVSGNMNELDTANMTKDVMKSKQEEELEHLTELLQDEIDQLKRELQKSQEEAGELLERLDLSGRAFRAKMADVSRMQVAARTLVTRAKNAEEQHERDVAEMNELSTLLTEKKDECILLLEEQEQLSDQVAEMRDVAEEKERRLQEHEDLLKIPSSDIKKTDILLGKGAYGEVAVGYWRGCAVAVKKFYQSIASEYYIRLFKQEIGICSRVRHPNIVSLYGVTTEGGIPLQVISELLEGSMSDVIKAATDSQCSLTLREKVDLAVGSSAGIAYLHQLGPRGVLHGDIRSSNIVVTALMVAKICDLGAARFAEVSKMVSVGPLSPNYLAPERNTEDHQPRVHNTKMADVYSLGVTLIELMTEQIAAASSRHSVTATIDHPAIKRLCIRSTKSEASRRPASQEILEGLQNIRQSEEYKGCPPKRMVRGKLHGGDLMSLVREPWAHTN